MWRGPSPLRGLDVWTSPRPTTPPDLDSSAPSAWNSSTNQNDLTSRHNGQPLGRNIPLTTLEIEPESQRIRCTSQSSNGNSTTPAGLDGPPQTLLYTTVSTARDFRRPEQGVQQTEPIPSHSSMTGFSIRLLKPQPAQGAVLVLPIENHVYLDLDLPLRHPMQWH